MCGAAVTFRQSALVACKVLFIYFLQCIVRTLTWIEGCVPSQPRIPNSPNRQSAHITVIYGHLYPCHTHSVGGWYWALTSGPVDCGSMSCGSAVIGWRKRDVFSGIFHWALLLLGTWLLCLEVLIWPSAPSFSPGPSFFFVCLLLSPFFCSPSLGLQHADGALAGKGVR